MCMTVPFKREETKKKISEFTAKVYTSKHNIRVKLLRNNWFFQNMDLFLELLHFKNLLKVWMQLYANIVRRKMET